MARQRLRRVGRATGARARSASLGCIVKTVSFVPDPLVSEDGIPQPQRLKRLNEIAIHQMKILSTGTGGRNLLK